MTPPAVVEGWKLPLLSGGKDCTFVSPPMPVDWVDTERPRVIFTDDGGVRWRLGEHGHLREADDEDLVVDELFTPQTPDSREEGSP